MAAGTATIEFVLDYDKKVKIALKQLKQILKAVFVSIILNNLHKESILFQAENTLEESLIKAAKEPAYRPQFIKDFIESNIFIIQEKKFL